MQQYALAFLSLFAAFTLYCEPSSEHPFTKEQCAHYASLLRNLSKKMADPLEEEIKTTFKKDDRVSSGHVGYHSFKAIHKKFEGRCDVYKGVIGYSNDLLYSDGRKKPGLQITFEGPYTVWGMKGGQNIALAQAQEKGGNEYEYRPEFEQMIEAFEELYTRLPKHTREVIKLDECTECEIYKRKKWPHEPAFECRLLLPEGYFGDLEYYQNHDTEIFEAGIKNYPHQNIAAYDYKKIITALLEKDNKDIEAAMSTIRNHALYDSKLAAFLENKKTVRPIIKQIAKKYGSQYLVCIAARLGTAGSLAWAQKQIQEYPKLAQELSELFTDCLKDKESNLILAQNILNIIGSVCDKDLLSKALVSASYYNATSSITFLINQGADIQFEHPNFMFGMVSNPLDAAVYRGSMQAVEALLAAGAQDKDGRALAQAQYNQKKYKYLDEYTNKYTAIIEMLEKAAGDQNK